MMETGNNISNTSENPNAQNAGQNTASASQNVQNPSTENVQSTMPENAPKRKSYKGLIIGVIMALIGTGAGAYFVIHSMQNDEEETAYAILENNDNPQDFEDYLAKFPNSEHAQEVRDRLAQLQAMIQAWNGIALSDNVMDFKKFKDTYSDAKYARLCDIKIDSLDWVAAQQAGTAEAYQHYLDLHSDGMYASEASIAQGRVHDNEITVADREQATQVCNDFFHGFEQRNEALITQNITSTMTTFLHTHNATKAEVMSTINGMFNEHIQSCSFVVNRDIDVQHANPSDPNAGYKVTFTVDQHIERDNEGKTFGSYQCVATLTPQFLISSLTMTETSATR